ncbi:MAG: 23S rRNA (guanosine(2251)-2'-O)-methyltransferase RlmB [Spirochaetaceae bacterium]|nr:MAG: 23S rRNA (guanosine(2251)-2'-O)-methyltransferase RlmB [Spirochaetaceae bacterium]
MNIPLTGFHAIEEILRKGRTRGSLYLSRDKKKNDLLKQLAEEAGVSIALVDDDELDRLSGKADHRGALLLLDEMPLAYKDDLGFVLAGIQTPNALGILLDGITDPHNFGAIIRTADQFCADFIITTSRRSVGETQTVVKTSSGASSYATIITIPNLNNAIVELKKHEFWIYGAEMDAPAANSVNLKGRVALVLGSEGKGLHRLVSESCDSLLSIPAKGHVDSFNVSVAAGILMYEVRRQQGF